MSFTVAVITYSSSS